MRDGDTVMFSSTTDRQRIRNLGRDPRVSVSVFATDNPYRLVEIRGTAELIDDLDRKLQAAVSHKYLGQDPPPDPDGAVRVAVRITAKKINSVTL